ncbi:MAG: putative zinc-binding protein [Caldisericia bacterium]
MEKGKYQLLSHCSKEANNLDIILACDGASSVGQVGHEVAVRLTKNGNGARMCCVTAIGANSKSHVDIARNAKRLIAINGCASECASKILRNLGIEPDYEITIAKEGVDKLPTLDFDHEDVERITNKIIDDLKNVKGKDSKE